VKPAALSLVSNAVVDSNRLTEADEVEAFYEQHYHSLYRFLILSGCPADEAPDYLQEAFIRLYKAVRDGSRIERPQSWLVRVLHHLRINEFRRSKQQALHAESVQLLWHRRAASMKDPESTLLDRERSEHVQSAIQELTEVQYQYLLLRLEGLKFREIAELYGVSIGSVADACGRALKKLGKLRHE
jgi:RNA polymerase sigma-70 factor, ECF subfamily